MEVLEIGGLSQFMRGGGHEKSVGECFHVIFWEQVRQGTEEGEGRKEARLRVLTINCHDGKTNK